MVEKHSASPAHVSGTLPQVGTVPYIVAPVNGSIVVDVNPRFRPMSGSRLTLHFDTQEIVRYTYDPPDGAGEADQPLLPLGLPGEPPKPAQPPEIKAAPPVLAIDNAYAALDRVLADLSPITPPSDTSVHAEAEIELMAATAKATLTPPESAE